MTREIRTFRIPIGARERFGRKPSLSDNYPLSDTGATKTVGTSAIDPLVAQYCQASRAANTRRAYASDLRAFETWGGKVPSASDEIAKYVACSAGSLRPGTLHRRLAALASAHQDAGFLDPTKGRLVRQVMQGIERSHGSHPSQVAPLLLDDLTRIVGVMVNSRAYLRDRALLLIGFFGALRRSEIVALDYEDVHFSENGLDLIIRKSKTDQLQVDRTVKLRRVNSALDPWEALREWLVGAKIVEGALFRRGGGVSPHG